MKKVKISLKKLTARNLIFIQIIYCAFIGWATPQFGLPGIFRYLTDVITMLLFIEILFFKMNNPHETKNKPVITTVVLFFVYTVICWLSMMYSPIHYLWGLRNNFRFYIFMIACILFLDEEDISGILKILYVIFLANVIMCTYQYFSMKRAADYVAGFMGSTETQGGNGPMVLMLTIVCITSTVEYMEKKCNLMKVLVAIAGTLYIATIAEIKILYLIVGLVAVVSNLFTRFSVKKILLIAIIITVLPIAINILYILYPNFEDFFSYEDILEYINGEQGYTSSGDINRLSAISYCMENFLETTPQKLFGIGLGNADGSTNYIELVSDFYRDNINTHYTWFSVPFMFIETGFVGLAFFFGIFANCFIKATKVRKKVKWNNRAYAIIGQVVSVFAVVIAFANPSLRNETMGYAYYMLLAIPYILRKDLIR